MEGRGFRMDRLACLLTYERGAAADTACVGHEDFSFKPVKGDHRQ